MDASGITTTSALLMGTANPGGSATTGWYRYSTTDPGTCSDTFGTRLPVAGGPLLGAGTSPVSYPLPVAGLSPATTYYYCAIAQNALGTNFGAVVPFTTQGPPSVTTGTATVITTNSATLNGSANPNGISATGWFRYAPSSPGTCNDVFGTRVPFIGGTSLGSGNAPVPFSEALLGLNPGTTYYVCAIAQNSSGMSFGSVVSFVTAGGAPSVTTGPASGISSTAATLNGTANPNSFSTSGWFRYSTADPGTCNDTFGTRAPAAGGSALGGGSSPVAYAHSIGGLVNGTTYFVCAIANNSFGTTFGSVVSFTAASPALTGRITYENAAVPVVNVPSVTLFGSGSPNVMTVSDAAGNYSLSGFGPAGYVVTPSRANMNPAAANGIFSNDAALVARHVVGLTTLTDVQQRAARVDGQPAVSAAHAGLIARWIVGVTDAISQAGQWKFAPVNRSYPVVTSMAGQDFAALLMGDVNGDWVSSPLRALPSLPWQNVMASLPAMNAARRSEIVVPFQIDNLGTREVTSFQFDVEYDPAIVKPGDIAAALDGTASQGMSVAFNAPSPGLLKVVVYGIIPAFGDGVFVNLKFVVTGAAGSSTPLTITGFRLNDGLDEVTTINGSVAVTGSDTRY
jgi:hypothetical protein